MTMDAITEKISHFIGAFEMIVEETRMRAEYDQFRAAKNAEDDAKGFELKSLKIKHSYKIDDYDPGLKTALPPLESLSPLPVTQSSEVAPFVAVDNAPIAGQNAVGAANGISGIPTTTINLNYDISPPSALLHVTYQLNSLLDNDAFSQIVDFSVETVATLTATLDLIVDLTASLAPIQIDLLPTSGNWMQAVKDIQETAAALSSNAFEPLQTAVHVGDHAQGTFVNGAQVDEAPNLDDQLPLYFANKIAEAEAAANDDTSHDFAQDFAPNPAAYDDVDGTTVIAGANTLINTTSISSNWLDADVIVVSGDVVRFDGISQVNVLIDHDSISDVVAEPSIADQASVATNAATIASKSAHEDKAVTTPYALQDAPENWAVVYYEGPVVQINWVTQHNFTTDFDQASVTTSGSGTYLGLGENKLSNDVDAFELGFQYDLILVGGDLIDVNLISQLNIVLDSDVVSSGTTVDASPPDAKAASIEVGIAKDGIADEEDDINGFDVAAVEIDDAVLPDSPEVAAPVENDLKPQPAAEGQTAIAAATESETPDVDEPIVDSTDETTPEILPEAPVSTGDNLLHNQAAIQTTGADTDVAITETFVGALNDFANGSETPSEDVLEDDLFDGTELLRVLYVDGDFTTVNILDQTNILGDADQVHIARDNFADELQSQIQVTTGANIAANIATIQDNGVDSTVMAQGETYSDALLHQANLVDNDLSDLGQSISDLATEAVAFLVDDVIPGDLAADIGSAAQSMVNDTMGQADIMQTMLA